MPILELPFGISVDFSFWSEVLNWPTPQLMQAVFAIVGWAILILVFFYMGAELWLNIKQDKLTKNWKWILLAVDIPPEQIQSPKAVEQIFAQLSGALIVPNFGEKYWQGAKQKWFSFEIISIEGYTQFLIYTESQFRDLVEAAIYAQYTTAEITEVEDYIGNVSSKFPNDTDDVLGVEFGLVSPDPYPIRTYQDFEHSVTLDSTFNDPMAAILETFSRIGAGEYFWTQIIIQPSPNNWKENGIKLIKDIIAQKSGVKGPSVLSQVAALPVGVMAEFAKSITSNPDAKPVIKKEPPAPKISDLTPGIKDTVAAIEEKIAKIGFFTKIRALYAARKEVFNPSKCLEGFIGGLNQFHIQGRNGLVPKKFTSAYYAFKHYRTAEAKRKFVAAYKKRKLKVGRKPYILNIEELATVWHFPLPLVKTPSLQKSSIKRSEPPINLPVESFASPLKGKTEEPKDELPPEEPMYG